MSEETLQAIENCGAAEMSIGETCAIAEIAEADYPLILESRIFKDWLSATENSSR